MLFRSIKIRWYQHKVNRWIRLQHEGMSVAEALKKVGLTATKALAFLEENLNSYLAEAGIVVISTRRDKFSFLFREKQINLILRSIAQLVPLLPDSEQQRIQFLLKRLTEHNWGYIREAADKAIAAMPKIAA